MNIFRPLCQLISFNDLLYLGFKAGDTELLRYDGSSLEKFTNASKTDDHNSQINMIDIHPKHKMFITCCKDGSVKVQNIRKELIKEIVFPYEVCIHY